MTERPWELPEGWQWARVGEVTEVNPRKPRTRRPDDAPTSFVPMRAVDEHTGSIAEMETRPYSELGRGYTYFEEGDVLFAKITPCMQNGKAVIARDLIDGLGFGTTEFHVLRPGPRVTAEWIHRYVRRVQFRRQAQRRFRGAVGQQRVPAEFMEEAPIPLPALDEQRRIVAKLDSIFERTREAKRLRASASHDAELLTKAAMADAFPDRDDNGHVNAWTWLPVGELADMVGGGTPRRSNETYWGGSIPWVSPKDMKTWTIEDTEDHVTPKGIEESSTKRIPAGSVLVVFRSGILAHSLPVAVNSCDVTMNQDMKALLLKDCFDAGYIAYALRSRAREVLSQCAKKGATVNSIESSRFQSFELPIPGPAGTADSLARQQRLVRRLDEVLERVRELNNSQQTTDTDFDELEQSVLDRAFRGEL